MKNRSARFRKTLIKVLTPTLPAIVAFGVLQYLTLSSEKYHLFYLLLISAVYVLCLLLVFRIQRKTNQRHSERDEYYTTDVNAMLYDGITSPIITCDEYGTIIWGNKAYSKLIEHYPNVPTLFSDLTRGVGISEIKENAISKKYSVIAIDNRTYRLDFINIEGEHPMYVTVWNDVTELENCRKRLEANESLIAYIYIDNLEEFSQFEKDRFSSYLTKVNQILNKWAQEVEGLLISYEKDKFILIYKKKYLVSLMNSKFKVLDQVREIRVGTNFLPITVSIGTSDIGTTFDEKNENAFSALKFALAKGGDQAIVKSQSGTSAFGGVSRTLQKRSSVKSQTVIRDLAKIICKSSQVMIMGHRVPDFDSIGSCVGIARLCMYLQVDFKIIVDKNCSNIKKCFDILESMPEYKDKFISGYEAQELIRSDTLLIICDVNNRRQFESPDVAEQISSTVYIDHHRMTEEFRFAPLLSYIEPSASSTCELVAEMLERIGDNILAPGEAQLMYAGIVLDTKHFVANTGVRTFESARYLRSLCDPVDVNEMFKADLEEIKREERFKISSEPYRDKIMIVVNDLDDNTQSDITLAAKVADKLLNIDGIEASFVIFKLNGGYRISGRSSTNINVEKILSRLGGGGHFNAAAAQPKDNVGTTGEEIKSKLIQSIDIFLDREINREDITEESEE